MTKELSREVLKSCLALWKFRVDKNHGYKWTEMDEQAYNQLVKLIEDSEKLKDAQQDKLKDVEGVDEEMIQVMDAVIERYRQNCPSPVKVTMEALTRINQLLSQKQRVVTRGWVDKWGQKTGMYPYHIEDILKELGMGVVDK